MTLLPKEFVLLVVAVAAFRMVSHFCSWLFKVPFQNPLFVQPVQVFKHKENSSEMDQTDFLAQFFLNLPRPSVWNFRELLSRVLAV